MKISEMRSLRRCKELSTIQKLHREKTKFDVIRETIDILKTSLVNKLSYEDTIKNISSFYNESYLPSSEDIVNAFDIEKKTVLRKIIRIVNYIYINKLNEKIVEINRTISLKINGEINGAAFDSIDTTADIVFFDNGKERIVSFKQGSSSLTDRKTSENWAGFDIQLETILSCFPDASVEFWYLENKDYAKETDTLFEFENRKGKNIQALTSEELLGETPTDYITLWLSQSEKRNCSNCEYSRLCNISSRNVVKNFTEKKVAKKSAYDETSAQKEFTTTLSGAIVCIAPPGSGKTAALVHRFKNLVASGVSADSILCLCFNNKAAGEITARLKAAGIKKELEVYTFHSFGQKLIDEYPGAMGNNRKVVDDATEKRLCKKALESTELVKGYSCKGATLKHGIIATARGWFAKIEKDGRDRFLAEQNAKGRDGSGMLRVYDKYIELLQKDNYITHNEQISIPANAINTDPILPVVLAEKYQYIMIDEAQDMSPDQAKLIFPFAKIHGNIALIGDVDQAIYGWRDGDSRIMKEAISTFHAKVIKLNDNFRSNEKIIALSKGVIKPNNEDLQVTAHKGSLTKPVYFKDSTIDTIVYQIQKALKYYAPEDIAILARTNQELYDIADALIDIVPTTSPKDYIKDDSEFSVIKALMDIFMERVKGVCLDDTSLYILMKWFNLEIPKFQDSLFNVLKAQGFFSVKSPMTLLITESTKVFQRCKDATDCIKELSILLDTEDSLLTNHILTIIKNNGFTNWKELQIHMEDMITFNDTTRVGYESIKGRVNLLTYHDAKGMEYAVVFLSDVSKIEDSQEARNSLYVGVTRAADVLYIFDQSMTGYVRRNEILPYVTIVG